MASLPFWILAAACALSYLGTPLKRGVTFVRRPFLSPANEKTGSPLGLAQGPPPIDASSSRAGSVSVPCAKPKGDPE